MFLEEIVQKIELNFVDGFRSNRKFLIFACFISSGTLIETDLNGHISWKGAIISYRDLLSYPHIHSLYSVNSTSPSLSFIPILYSMALKKIKRSIESINFIRNKRLFYKIHGLFFFHSQLKFSDLVQRILPSYLWSLDSLQLQTFCSLKEN